MHDTVTGYLEAALDYAQRGWPVFPAIPGDKEPLVSWRRANADEETIRAWWEQWPTANVCIRTGEQSGLYVVDIDGSVGARNYERLTTEYGSIRTATAVTGGNGLHLYLAYPNGVKLPNTAGRIADHIDTRGEGGYIVAPPSTHVSGKLYNWLIPPSELAPQPIPHWLLDKLLHTNGTKTVEGIPDSIEMGERNDTLFRVASRLRRDGLSVEEILAALTSINDSRCTPPLDNAEVERIANGAGRYDPVNTLTVVPVPASGFRLTDMGNAERLVARHGRDLRYSDAFGWLVWDTRRWQADATSLVVRHAKETVRAIYAEAATAQDDARREAIAKHAVKSESARSLEAMIKLAQSEPSVPITPDSLDADPWLLNTLTGTLDLTSGELRPSSRSDLLSRLLPVKYDASATCPTWLSFLSRVMDGDQSLIDFLQRAVGYSLTGITREQCIFILYGSGANGKSTFLETVYALLGDYATKMRASSLMAKKNDAVPTDLARLKGSRFVSASEADDRQHLAEALVKEMTGQETLTARFLYRDEFSFMPEFKIFLSTNHKPVIRSTDYAMWRRIRMMPWLVTIPEDEQDKHLQDKLRGELPGILNWAILGCLEWQLAGLAPPTAVLSATQAYREEMDALAAFFSDRCEFGPSHTAAGPQLYDSYRLWCESNGEAPVAAQSFGRKLNERGLTKRRGAYGQAVYVGIRMKAMSATAESGGTV